RGEITAVRELVRGGMTAQWACVCETMREGHLGLAEALLGLGVERNAFTMAAMGDAERLARRLVRARGGRSSHCEHGAGQRSGDGASCRVPIGLEAPWTRTHDDSGTCSRGSRRAWRGPACRRTLSGDRRGDPIVLRLLVIGERGSGALAAGARRAPASCISRLRSATFNDTAGRRTTSPKRS